MSKFNLYPQIFEKDKGEEITANDFFNGIKLGRWKDLAQIINAEPDPKKRLELKKKVPYATVSGLFDRAQDSGLRVHSDLIAMDFDKLDQDQVVEYFAKLKADPYTYALFRSISGRGICAIVRIDGNRHLDSFLALEKYYLSNYGLLTDSSCKNVSRARYVSYDPDLFKNEKAKIFKNYLPKKALKAVPEVIYTGADIDSLFKQIAEKRVDLTNSDYERYLHLAFALHSEFGENGRQYFHLVACNSEKYNEDRANKQFDYCVRSMKTGITIASFFHYAKEAGLQVTSKKTQTAAAIVKQVKKAGRDEESAKKTLAMEGIGGADADQIIDKIFNSNAAFTKGDDLSLLGQLELFLSTNYRLKRNVITRNIENKGEILETKDLNSIYILAKKLVDESVNYQDLEKLINSDFTEDYNPILDFFETYRSRKESGCIKALSDCIESDTGLQDLKQLDKEYKEYFITKWLVGMIASAHGQVSPLMLALTGGQNAGKTEFFRRLLPDKLQNYYAESKLDAGKDDEILMTQKLLVMDDELGGKTKQDEKRLKELTSKKIFTLREPYGKKNVDLKRLAVLAGTTNEKAVLSDPTGNRRIIPINVLSINHEAYNKIDKVSLLMEAFHLYQSGYEYWLNKEDIARLNINTQEFEQVRPEYELILQFFKKPEAGDISKEYLTATQIKTDIETNTNQRITTRKLGEELQALGFRQQSIKVSGATARVYCVVRVNTSFNPFLATKTDQPAASEPEQAAAEPEPIKDQPAADESDPLSQF